MSWRGLYISESASLSLKNGSLFLRQKEGGEYSLPLEDLGFIVLETTSASISSALLSACAQTGCLIICCDNTHMPNGALLPLSPYHRQAETVQAQLKLSLPRQKRLWQKIVCAKIRNQAHCLRLAGRTEKEVNNVALFERKVPNADSSNMEGAAARSYWGAYLKGFLRQTDGGDRLNIMLNYGYAILRSAIARELAACGFITSIGLHHQNMQNAFNLADDLIEPWRPFIDLMALQHWEAEPERQEFNKNDKAILCSVLHKQVLWQSEQHQIISALRVFIGHFRSVVMEGGVELATPGFCEKECLMK